MFQRRLLLLAGLFAVASVAPAVQIARLTVAKGDQLRAEAEKRLVTERWIDSDRGRILDRKGRVLALDRPCFDIAVDYNVITGRWVYQRAQRKARQLAGFQWAQMSAEQREAATQQHVPQMRQHLESAWDTLARVAGVSREEIDSRRAEIRDQVEYEASTTLERRRDRERATLAQKGRPESDADALTRTPIAGQAESHVLLRGVSDEVGFALRKLRDESAQDEQTGRALPIIPGLEVRDAARRDYPLDVMDVSVDLTVMPPPLRHQAYLPVRVEGVGTHVVGWMRSKLQREDLDRRPRRFPDGTIDRGHYRPGDQVGMGGVEQAFEDQLRGIRGVERRHVDTGELELVEPTPGKDVTLTIDAMLQARIQALFDPSVGLAVVQPWHRLKKPEDAPTTGPKELPLGTALNGAVVVLDVESGEILSMVSHPSFTHEQRENAPQTILGDAYNTTYLNRAIDKPYPPGSIVKPLVLCGAAQAGKYAPGDRVACTGHFFPDKPLLYRCWIYKQHHTTHSAQLTHDLDGADGIKCSCNIFFFEMGRRLGVSGIHDVFTEFGVGRDAPRWNLFELPPLPEDKDRREKELARRRLLSEYPGSLPDPAKTSMQEGVLMGIGQGPIVWTPLHAADAYATIARGGVRLTPRLIHRTDETPSTRTPISLNIPDSAVRLALKGLYGAVHEQYGTAYQITYPLSDGTTKPESVFTPPGLDVWAKTGTADTNPFRADFDLSGGQEEYDGDHAWAAVLVGVNGKPKYAISVVVDYGGSGGKVSGPLANQVLWALIAEGYLPDARPDKSADAKHTRAMSPRAMSNVDAEGR